LPKKSGELDHSLLHDLLEEFGEQEDAQDATAILYLAASDTTTGAIVCFLHTLYIYPDIAQRVYQEICSITQGQRLPKISDRVNLPFTEAVFKEAVRMYPFMTLGVPHVNNQDEILEGYLIPKGTLIHVNTGTMCKNVETWGDPEVFRPERFLERDAAERPNPLLMTFGYGMRVCPGMYFC
ncbi:cytochrome P450, partial [Serendipita vermifera]